MAVDLMWDTQWRPFGGGAPDAGPIELSRTRRLAYSQRRTPSLGTGRKVYEESRLEPDIRRGGFVARLLPIRIGAET